MLDRRALYATSFVRAVTTSLVGVLVGAYLARLNVSGVGFGVVVIGPRRRRARGR